MNAASLETRIYVHIGRHFALSSMKAVKPMERFRNFRNSQPLWRKVSRGMVLWRASIGRVLDIQ